MAEAARSRIDTYNFGSKHLYKVTFTDVDDTNTFASSFVGIVDYWFQVTDNETAQSGYNNIDVQLSGSTFTFNCPEDSKTGYLYILTS